MQTQIPNEIKVKSMDEAEKRIYQLTIQSIPQNEITQIAFNINDDYVRHFSPSQISKVKKKIENLEENNDENKDFVTAELFKDFEKGDKILDIVMKKGYKLEIVEMAFEKYTKLKEIETVPKEFMNSLRESCYKLESHIEPNNPTPKSKIDFTDIDTFMRDCIDISILSETEDLRIHKPTIKSETSSAYHSREKPVFYSIFQNQ